ncbi:MAG TPA: carboxypeptidase-like regulatory domain-containing protein, partial [Saprospiraceae bacterium]|nr:carboxypeptidase-like regulatory domain-containing protein [Saprospiraceae bacterium]
MDSRPLDWSYSVTEGDGTPIVGVTVQVKGANQGTVTDVDGRFTLDVPEGSILVFSSVGFKTREIPATVDMTIVLESDNKLLNQVVVVG